MARPTKQGLDYFPLDVDIFENVKIEAISGEFGVKGELLVIKLLCAVYKEGYYIVWSDLLKMQLLKRVQGASIEFLDQVVNRLVKWGMFDEALFNSDMVLTSVRIQENFKLATSRRKDVDMSSYCLLDVDNNPELSRVNVDINPQSKLNKSKLNKSKVKKIYSPSDDVPESLGSQEGTPRSEADTHQKCAPQAVGAKQMDDDFEKLWNLYPNKKGKSKAKQAYIKAIKDGVTNRQIQDGIMAYRKENEIKGQSLEFIKHGSTWFNQRAWEDEYDTTPEQPKFRGKPKKQENLPSWMDDDYQSPSDDESDETDKDLPTEEELRDRINGLLGGGQE